MFSLNKKLKMFTILLLFATTLLSLNTLGISAAGPLDMEYSYKWSSSSTIAVDVVTFDVDNDGIVEIITVGVVSETEFESEIRITTWDGTIFNVEHSEIFQVDGLGTYVRAVDVGDITGDGTTEIVVTGHIIDPSDASAWIQVYRWDGSVLALLDTVKWTGSFAISFGVEIGDLDNDGSNEVVTVGSVNDGTDSYSQIRVWSWSAGLNLEDSQEWADAGTGANSAMDVDIGVLDGDMMIAVCGDFYDTSPFDYYSELTVWSFSSSLNLEDRETWQNPNWMECNGVHISDGKIFTVGEFNDGVNLNGQLRVWSWGSLTLEDSKEWFDGDFTDGNNVYSMDLDGDGEIEIVTVGSFYDGTRDNAKLRVWNFAILQVTLKDDENWFSVDHADAFSVHLGDVDADGVPEIITCGYANNWETGHITIWSYPDNTDPTISNSNPTSGSEVSNTKPTITATLGDDFAGIDVDSVSITVDGTDVTSSATITPTSISYTSLSDLSEGFASVIVTVSDKSGNDATESWTFTVKLPPPGIPGFPLEGLFVGITVAAVALLLLRKRTISSGSLEPNF